MTRRSNTSASTQLRSNERTLLYAALIGTALVLVFLVARQLGDAESRVTGASGARPSTFVATIPRAGGRLCQDAINVPAGTGSLDMLIGTFGKRGPELALSLFEKSSKRLISRSSVRAGWTEGTLNVPVRFRRPFDGASNARLCVRVGPGVRLSIAGEPDVAPATVNGRPTGGRISVNARSLEQQSVADLLPTFAKRIGRGNAGWVGPWSAYVIGAALLVAVALGGIAILQTEGLLGQRDGGSKFTVPRVAWTLSAAALSLGLAWAILTPPFQVPDETSHVAYVQYLSTTGRPPVERADVVPYSGEEREILGAIGFGRIIGRPLEQVISSPSSERVLRNVERRDFPLGGGNATTASANPPLYYMLQSPVFWATSRGSLLTQLLAMRMLSVLFVGGSVFFAFMFVREMMPASPWTWTAGALACAFQPVLGFIGSGVNPDSLLFLCATALFFLLARVIRCGLTTKRAAGIGVAIAAGLLTKPLFLALIPVAVAGLVAAAIRQRQVALRPLILTATIAAIPVFVIAVLGAVFFDHPYFATASSVASSAGDTAAAVTSFSRQASFVLQLFLPRLPFLNDQIPGVPLQDIWINGTVGVFGWVDYGFDASANVFATRVFIVMLFLTAVTLAKHRQAVWAQWPLALMCLVGLASVAGVVGLIDYQAFIAGSARFEQARYLLPLLALYAGLFALSAKALGPRLGQLLLPVLWLLVAFHTVAAVLLTVNRYYI